MILICCVDNRMGMLFNHRRVSSDKVLTAYLCDLTKEKNLYMNNYSSPLFENAKNKIVCDDFLEKAGTGDYCFVENTPMCRFFDKIEGIILCKWNRNYPSDFKLDLDISQLKLQNTYEFVGNSHEKITLEEYRK